MSCRSVCGTVNGKKHHDGYTSRIFFSFTSACSSCQLPLRSAWYENVLGQPYLLRSSDFTIVHMIFLSSANNQQPVLRLRSTVTICWRNMHYLVKTVVKANVTGRIPGGLGNITELSGGFRSVIKERLSHFAHATHLFHGNHLLIKLNSVAWHKKMKCPAFYWCPLLESASAQSITVLF